MVQHTYICMCPAVILVQTIVATIDAAMSATQMTESMWEIGRSKGTGERVHSQYNRLYWWDYQISFVYEEGQ